LKILFVTCAYPPYTSGGVANLLRNLSVEFVKRKHQVYIFSLVDDLSLGKRAIINTNVNGIKARFINIQNSSSTHFFSRYAISDYYNPEINLLFKEYLSEIKPDVIHFHAIQGLGANLITEAHKEGYPTILTMHDMWWFCPNLFVTDLNLEPCDHTGIDVDQCVNCLHKLNEIPEMKYLKLESFLMKRNSYLKNVLENDVDIIFTVSKTFKKYLQNNIARNIKVNENGIAKVLQTFEKEVNPNKIIFGFVGGKSELKGYNILMEAFRTIDLSNWELHIYGVEKTDVTDFRKAFIQNIKNKTFWTHLVRFLVERKKEISHVDKVKYFHKYSDTDKYETINKFDVIIVPSVVRESFSLITREGLMLKKPVICSDCGGPEEVIKDSINGLIFKTNDAQDLKVKISTLLKNPGIVNAFKNNIDVKDITTIEMQVDELENIYRLQDQSHHK